MRALARMFKALSDETRLEIVAFLGLHGELCVCDLQELLGATQSRTSRHLGYLQNAGLVHGRRGGAWVYYRLAEEGRRREVLAMARSLLGPEEREALQGRLDEWFARKARTAAACPTPGLGGGGR